LSKLRRTPPTTVESALPSLEKTASDDAGRIDLDAVRLELDYAQLEETFGPLIDPHVIYRAVRNRRGRVADFEYIGANDAAIAANRTTREALIGARLLDLFPRHLQSGLFDQLVHTLETGEPLIVDDFLNPSMFDGSDRYFDLRGVKNGDSLRYSWRDVTERHQLLEQFQLLAENASDVVMRTQPEGPITWISPSVTGELGWEPEQLIGQRIGDLAHPDDRHLRDELFAQLDATGRGTVETRLRALSGEYRHFELSAHDIVDQQGTLYARIASLRNIDHEVAGRTAIQVGQDILDATMRAEIDPHALLRARRDDEGRIVDFEFVDANEAAVDYYRTTREELLGASLMTMLPGHDPTGLFDLYVRTIETGERLLLDGFAYPNPITGLDRYYDIRAVKLGDLLSYSWRDVTDWERTLTRYRLLAENAADVVFQTSADFVIEWVSPSVKQLLDLEPSELIGQAMVGLMHPDDLESLNRIIEVTGLNERNTAEARVRNARGDFRWVSIWGRSIADERGATIGFIGSVRDNQADHENREALVESELHYRLLAENAADVVFQASADFVAEWVSPSVEQLLGTPPDEIVGKSISDLIHPDDIAAVLATIESSEADERLTAEARVLNARNDYQWVSFWGRTMKGESGVTVGYIGSVRSAESTHASRQALIESEARYRLLAENGSDVIVVGDNDGRLEWVSESVGELLGWRPEQMVGESARDYVHADDQDTVLAAWDHLRTGGSGTYEARMRRADGAYRWVSVAVRQILDDQGRPVSRIASWRDAQEEVEGRRALADSERRFRLLAENASDVIYETDTDGIITWVSPSVEQVLGWSAKDLIGVEGLTLVVEEDLAMVREWRAIARKGGRVERHETRFRTNDGEFVWMSVQVRPLRDASGEVVNVIVALRNVQEEVQARRALTTLSEGNRSLVRAEHEIQLLSQMCQVAVDQGGYQFAWYGRRVDDAGHSVAKLASSRLHREYLYEIEVTWGEGPTGQGPAGRAIRLGETVVIQDFRADIRMTPWSKAAAKHGMRSSVALPVRVSGQIDGALLVYAPEPHAFNEFAVGVLEDLAVEIGLGIKRLRDRELLVKSLSDQSLLTNAIEQSGEAIVISDPASNIVYVNSSALRSSGYAREELLGENPRIFQSGLQNHQFYEEMWAELTGGQSWRGVLVNRSKEGDLYEEDTTISPIHDADGTLVAYVAVKHDLTTERRLEADLSREQRDRNSIVEVMRAIRPAETIQATAGAFCETATRLANVDAMCVMLRDDSGALLPVALSGSKIFDVNEEFLLIPKVDLLERIKDGPVQLDLSPAQWPGNPHVLEAALAENLRSIVLAPIRWEGELIGVLGLGTKDDVAVDQVKARFSYFEELGSYAGTFFGAQAEAYRNRSALRSQLRHIIDARGFHPVFQPVIDLLNGAIVGYEALTRFDDGARPDVRFIEAHTVGLGTELEAACVEVALEASSHLPHEIFLSLNFSPAALLDGRAAATLAHVGRTIVIEVTEHARIDDYPAVRRAVDAIEGCQLAVDDAGAGYTSLNHILELRPDYVKLDISIVRGIDTNPARQAMAAGMCHFAAQSGTIIIAEGIETEAEAECLRNLGVPLGRGGILGQGFHFARPSALPWGGAGAWTPPNRGGGGSAQVGEHVADPGEGHWRQ
jgi:PAS domain S-box-containing protein